MTVGTQHILLCSNWKWAEKWKKWQTSEEHPDSSNPLPFIYEVSPRFLSSCPGIYRKNAGAEREIPQIDPGLQHLWVSVNELEWKTTGRGALIQTRIWIGICGCFCFYLWSFAVWLLWFRIRAFTERSGGNKSNFFLWLHYCWSCPLHPWGIYIREAYSTNNLLAGLAPHWKHDAVCEIK